MPSLSPRSPHRHAALLTGLTAATFVGILGLSLGSAVLRAQTDPDPVTETGAIAEEMSSSAEAASSSEAPSSVQALPQPASSAGVVALTLRPHCEKTEQQRCPLYTVTSPLNLETPVLSVGDTLDMDILEQNIRKLSVGKIRSWLIYDPTVLEGTAIVPFSAYSVATPGEQEFDAENGYAKVEVQPDGQPNQTTLVPVAQVTFTVKSVPPGGKSIISFYDPDGDEPHTAVTTAGDAPTNVLSKNLGSLAVRIGEQGESGTENNAPVPETAGAAPDEHSAPAVEEGSTQPEAVNAAPDSLPPDAPLPPASDPVLDPPAEPEPPVATLPPEPEHAAAAESSSSSVEAVQPTTGTTDTTFALLQVQNVRVTTVDGSLFIAWDLLAAPGLQGYYVFYGTDTGRYIQRKSVASTERMTAIYGLPDGTRYFVAVRGVRGTGEETAFSGEAAVVIGDPQTSTAPLSQRDVPIGKNPVKAGQGAQVPGESGTPSAAILLLILSAIIGTGVALRRQTIVFRTPKA